MPKPLTLVASLKGQFIPALTYIFEQSCVGTVAELRGGVPALGEAPIQPRTNQQAAGLACCGRAEDALLTGISEVKGGFLEEVPN